MSIVDKRTNLSLRQLELLLALASSEGIASAGAKLGMTPSATSHALKALESALGADLVDRSHSGLRLSFTGMQLVPHVRDVFTSLQLVSATAQAGAELKSGQLTMGSFGASATLHALPPIIAQFRDRYPGVRIVVRERPDAETVRDIMERRLEVAAVTLPKHDLETVPLAVDELVAVLPEGHMLAKKDAVTLQEVVRHPFIMTLAGSQALITRLFAKHDLIPDVRHELLQILSILEYVSRDEGVSILARLALPTAYPGVKYIPLCPTTQRRIGLACLNANKLSPIAKAFWELSRRQAENSSKKRA